MLKKIKNDYLKICQILITFLAGSWIIAGIYAIVLSTRHKNTPAWVFVLMAVLMLLDAVLLLLFSNRLSKQSIWSYRFLIVLLAVNALLIFTDQVGFVDLIVLLLTIAPLSILIFRRSYFIQPPDLT